MNPVHLQQVISLLVDFLFGKFFWGHKIVNGYIEGLVPGFLELCAVHKEFVVYHTYIVVVQGRIPASFQVSIEFANIPFVIWIKWIRELIAVFFYKYLFQFNKLRRNISILILSLVLEGRSTYSIVKECYL